MSSKLRTKTPKPPAIAAAPLQDMQGELKIGQRLKMVREAFGVSQRELAKRAGVTNASISLIEQDAHAPSVVSLHKILRALPMSLADFFAIPPAEEDVLIAAPEDLTVITRGEADMRCLASQRRDKRLQMFFEHYAPNAGTGEDLIVHDGETAAIVVEGTIELEIGGKAHTIVAGGGYQLFSRVPYRIRNAGDTPVVVVCAVTPPML